MFANWWKLKTVSSRRLFALATERRKKSLAPRITVLLQSANLGSTCFFFIYANRVCILHGSVGCSSSPRSLRGRARHFLVTHIYYTLENAEEGAHISTVLRGSRQTMGEMKARRGRNTEALARIKTDLFLLPESLGSRTKRVPQTSNIVNGVSKADHLQELFGRNENR